MKNEILVTNNVVATLKNTLAEFNYLLKDQNFELISREFVEDGHLQLIYRLEGSAIFWDGEHGVMQTLRNLATKRFFDNGEIIDGVQSCCCDDFIVAKTSDDTLVVTYFG